MYGVGCIDSRCNPVHTMAGPGTRATVPTGAATHAPVFETTGASLLAESTCESGIIRSCTEVPVEFPPVVSTAIHRARAGVGDIWKLVVTNSGITRSACSISVHVSLKSHGPEGARTVTVMESISRGMSPST